MNDLLKIETILGYVAKQNPLRASRDGKEFEGIIPAPSWSEIIIKRNGSVIDTVHAMRRIIKQYAWQTAKLAPLLKGKNLDETCRNIWNFLYTHIKYKEDDEGKEQLRTPARSWAQRLTRGIDCDDFDLFAGTILYNLHIPNYIRIARYSGKNYFQHVYPVVPKTDQQYITIDAVLDQYDTEKQPVETKDFLVMNTTNLNGIDISMLGGIEDETHNEISGILSGADFKELDELQGLGQVPTAEAELGAIRRHLQRTRNIIARRPELIQETEHPESFLGQVDYALKYWDTNKRDEALDILSGEEERINMLEGFGSLPNGHEDIELFYGLNNLGSYDVLGKAKRQRKFFTKVKSAVKKVGKGIKKIGKGLIKYNPLTVTIRAAVLLALKVNLMKISTKLKWGYLTEEEAKSRGFDMEEWRKVKTQLAKAEKLFVSTLQGKAENFKRAILSGRGGKLSGFDTGMGVVAAATTAASTTAAVPFITKIVKLLKNINFKKLVSKVAHSKVENESPQAEGEETPTEEGGTSIPENENPGTEDTGGASEEADTGSDSSGGESETTNGSDPDTPASPSNKTMPAGKSGAENNNPENLPAKTSTARMAVVNSGDSGEKSFITKAVDWVKDNKGTSLLIGGGVALLLYTMLKPKGLSGTSRRGAKKKGNAKTNPPKTISGIKKQAKQKSKAKPKGGSNRKFKL